jgi:hypothetical protein
MYYLRCPLDGPDEKGLQAPTINDLKAILIDHVKRDHQATGSFFGSLTDQVAADTWAHTYVPANCHQ